MHVLAHGGAGGIPEEPENRQRVIDEAVQAGVTEDDPAAAVLRTIGVLESSPRFNAGVGSSVQSDGVIRTDAGMMHSDGSVGAVAAVEGVANAIAVADAVRTETPHVLLCGRSGERFAALNNIPTSANLWTERTQSRWDEESLQNHDLRSQLATVRERFGERCDTVGAVASDGKHLVAGTSTGGRWLALAGRVGDVPQVGCGFYASPAGAVSTTGAGEGIATVTMARLAERALARGKSPRVAADTALDAFVAASDGSAGIIVLGPTGDYATRYSSDAMQTAVASD